VRTTLLGSSESRPLGPPPLPDLVVNLIGQGVVVGLNLRVQQPMVAGREAAEA